MLSRSVLFLAGAGMLAIAAAPLVLENEAGSLFAQVLGGGSAEGSSDPSPPVPAGAASGTAPAEPPRQVPPSHSAMSLSFAPLVKASAPSVVNVYAARRINVPSPFAGDPFFEQFFGRGRQARPRVESSLGSGVIVAAGGLVVTNNHVVEGADDVKVALSDGREFASEILLKDARADLAILRIQSDDAFPFIEVADSDKLEIGDLVLAIGNPFGIGQTVTSGIVSALARSHVGVSDFGFFIQTDAAINPGNSGGALIDMEGRLVGINTAIFSRSGGSNGIGFAIPSNMVRVFLQSAESGGHFVRPFTGAGFAELTPDIAEALGLDRPVGALVESVMPDSPAARAGIKAGDVVLAVGGFPIEHPDALQYRLATTGIGNTARLTVLSSGERRDAELALETAPEIPERDLRVLAGRHPFSGATVANLSPRLADELEMRQGQVGVVVMAVDPRSIAARVGLQPKDIILALGDAPVLSTADLEDVLAAGIPRAWRIEIDRGGRRFTRVVR